MSFWADLPEMDAILTKARRDGVSFSAIPAKLKHLAEVSRSACIGRAKRIGLAVPIDRKAQALGTGSVIRRMAARRVERPIPMEKPMRTEPVLETMEFARPWEERKPRQCAWPFDVDDAIWSCCAQTGEGRTYCKAHERRMWRRHQAVAEAANQSRAVA